MKKNRDASWFVIFTVLVIVIFVVVYALTGQDALGAAIRFVWNGLVFFFNAIVRLFSGTLGVIARGVGWSRLTRLSTVLAGVGLGYAGALVLDEASVRKAQGWRQKLKASITVVKNSWQGLHLIWKLAIIAALIASQVYLHFLLIVFPIAFLVPVVRRLWIRVIDLLFGSWYWQRFGEMHRLVGTTIGRLPGFRQVFGATRILRMRYLTAWRLWKYDPVYRIAGSNRRRISLAEPVRLMWRGELDKYIGRPLLSGGPAPGRQDLTEHTPRSDSDSSIAPSFARRSR